MRILSPLRHRQVAAIWSALAFSALGDQLYAVALGWVAAAAFGPAAGYLGAARAAIVLLAAGLGGGLADRWNRQRTMVAADLLRAAILALLVAAWLARGQPPALLLGVAVIVLAAAEAFFAPALQTILPSLVAEPRLLLATNALLDATARLARLLGPGLIAALGARIAPVYFFALDAASFLLSAAAVATLRTPPATMPTRTHFRDSLTRGFRAMRADPLLGYILSITGLLNGAWDAVFFLALPLAILRLDIGAAGLPAYGFVMGAYGVSNLLANLVVGSCDLPTRPARWMFAGILLTGLGIFVMGVVSLAPLPQGAQVPALAAAAALSGIGGPLKDIPFATLRQLRIPRPDIAAAMRAYLIVGFSGVLLAMLLAPTASAFLGPAPVMLACGTIYLAVAGIGVVKTRSISRR